MSPKGMDSAFNAEKASLISFGIMPLIPEGIREGPAALQISWLTTSLSPDH